MTKKRQIKQHQKWMGKCFYPSNRICKFIGILQALFVCDENRKIQDQKIKN